jgi:hypothetical protein
MERAKTMGDRGYYFDFVEFAKNQEQDMTPSTPCISLIYALESKLDDIFTEGVEARHARHAALNAMVHNWVKARGFEFFAPEGYRSVSLTCVANNREIDIANRTQQKATGAAVTTVPDRVSDTVTGVDASAADLEEVAQLVATIRLLGLLADDFEAAVELSEELVVEVVAVGQDDDGRVLHGRVLGYPAGVEEHREALA